MKTIKQLCALCLVLSFFYSCNEEETSYALQDVSAPTNVSATFDIAQDQSGMVSATPTADGATAFQIYFGDTEGETPTTIAPGETATHTYGEGTFTFRIVAVGLSGLTSELSRVVTISFDAPSDLAYMPMISESNPFEVTVTPSATNATVFDVYFGDVENEEATVIMAGESAVHVYEMTGDYTIRVVARGAGAATSESTAMVTIAGASDPITLPITFESATVNYAFESFGSAAAVVVDNPNAAGSNTSAKVGQLTKPAGAEVWAGALLTLENPIDFSTNKMFKMKVNSPKSGITVKLKLENLTDANISSEIDVVNTVANDWEELVFDFTAIDVANEYQKVVVFFDFGTPGDDTVYLFDDIQLVGANAPADPTEAPAVPMDQQANVRSIYSDSYTDPSMINYYPDWGQSTTFEQVDFDGNSVIKYANMNYQGVDFGEDIDATIYSTVHIDVWSNDYTSLPFFLISRDSGEKSVAISLVSNQWNSIDIPLTDYTSQGMSVNDLFQLKFDVQPDNGGTIYIDNIYFKASTAADPTEAPAVPMDVQADVRSIYSDSYTDPAMINYYPDWGQSTTFEQVDFAGNSVIKYANMNYEGIDFGEDIDATSYSTVHIDVWSNDYTSLQFFLISRDSGEKSVAISLEANQWNSIDIPLNDYTSQGLSVTDLYQLKFDVQPNNGGTVYIDNVYFHN